MSGFVIRNILDIIEDGSGYNASAFLIAQFEKNATYNGELSFTGNKLMEQAIEALRAA